MNIFKKGLAILKMLWYIKIKKWILKGPEGDVMRKFLIVSHGNLASGFVSMIDIIFGNVDNLNYYNGYTENDLTLTEYIKMELDNLDSEDELVILSDLLGGSVNTEAMTYLKDPRIHIVTGTNANLLLIMLTALPEENTKDLITRAVQESKKGIVYCNEFVCNDHLDLDEF